MVRERRRSPGIAPGALSFCAFAPDNVAKAGSDCSPVTSRESMRKDAQNGAKIYASAIVQRTRPPRLSI